MPEPTPEPTPPPEWVKLWDEFINKQKHLPSFMRDFHDQKDLFKTVHDWLGKTNPETASKVSWVDGQCYVIDMFLKFMAAHGYTLQKCRAKQGFANLHERIKERKEREAEAFASYLRSREGGTT